MHFSRQTAFELWILVSIFVAYTIATGSTTVNLRIGFDLSQGKNGAPLLRILNNDASSEKSLKKGHENHEEHRVLRTVSSSESEDDNDKKKPKPNSGEVSLKPRVAGVDSSDDSDSGSGPEGDSNPKSTKGIKRDEFEPEDNPRVHGEEDSDGDSTDRRKKRAAGSYFWSSS